MDNTYNEYIKDLRQYYKAYQTDKPVLRKNKSILPDDFRKYFTHIEYNDKLGCFIFANSCDPISAFKFYVNVTETRNFVGQQKFYFSLSEVKYIFNINNKSAQFTLKPGSRLILLKSIFETLYIDGSLEYFYKKAYNLS
jgi:hypothetical protein